MENFILNFGNQLLDQDGKNLKGETTFRDLDDWDSLTAMAVIAMIEDDYDVKITDEDFKKFKTVGDIFNHIASKK